jgi:hypothetical protein
MSSYDIVRLLFAVSLLMFSLGVLLGYKLGVDD